MSNATQPKRQAKRPPYGGVMSSLAHSKAGSVLPIYAVGTLVLAGLVGGGVDMARAYQAERRLQAACDSGALAGRRAVGTKGFDDAAEEQADKFFNVNFDPSIEQTSDTVFTATSPDDGSSVIGTATATLPTVIMPIFGITTIDLSVECTASMGVGNSDVMFVLDTTGSMRETPAGNFTRDPTQTRIFALQGAMRDFYDTVAASTAGGNARVRYAFVPYSQSVNVGRVLTELNKNFIADRSTVQSREPVNWSAIVDQWTSQGTPTNESQEPDTWTEYSSVEYSSESSCKNAKPSNETSWSNVGRSVDEPTEDQEIYFDSDRYQRITAIGTQQSQRRAVYDCERYTKGKGKNKVTYYKVIKAYYTRTIASTRFEARNPIPVTASGATFEDWLYRPIEYDTSSFKNFRRNTRLVDMGGPGKRTSNVAETWEGCIIERRTTPAATFRFESLDAGIVPSEALDLDIDSAPTSDLATQWAPLWGSVGFRRDTVEPNIYGSPSSAGATCPVASRNFEEMDEGDFDDYVATLQAGGNTYHDIGILWGARLASPTGIFADNVNDAPSNGGAVSRHLIFMTDGELQPHPDLNTSYGIEFVDRRVTADGTGGRQRARHRQRFLALCEAVKARGIRLWVIAFGTELDGDLTTCGSPDSSFQSDNAEQLSTTFQEIANQVGELRIVQ